MAMEEAIQRPKYLFFGDIVNEMFESFVEDLISIAKYKNSSSENVSEHQVQEWVRKLLTYIEHDNELLELDGPVTLAWMMSRAIVELQIEIEKYLSKKSRKSFIK